MISRGRWKLSNRFLLHWINAFLWKPQVIRMRQNRNPSRFQHHQQSNSVNSHSCRQRLFLAPQFLMILVIPAAIFHPNRNYLIRKNKENRSFQAQWYVSFPWLTSTLSNKTAFCFHCRYFSASAHMKNRAINPRLSTDNLHSFHIRSPRLGLVNEWIIHHFFFRISPIPKPSEVLQTGRNLWTKEKVSRSMNFELCTNKLPRTIISTCLAPGTIKQSWMLSVGDEPSRFERIGTVWRKLRQSYCFARGKWFIFVVTMRATSFPMHEHVLLPIYKLARTVVGIFLNC